MDELRLILDRKIRKDLALMEALWERLETAAGGDLPGEAKELVFIGFPRQIESFLDFVASLE